MVEVVELAGVEVELVERERDLLGGERSAGGLRSLEQVPRLVGLQDVGNFRGRPALPVVLMGLPCLGDAALCLPGRTGRHGPFGSYFRYLVPSFRSASRIFSACAA